MSPVMSPAKLRMIGLGAAVAVAVLLPIVAVAGPTGDPVRPAGTGDAKSGDGGLLPDLGLGLGSRTAEPAVAGPDPAPASAAPSAPSAPSTPSAVPAAPERITKCGPELASPEGIEAQTCVLAEGPDTWARTYYRNATGQELDAFLTLMAPGGRTVHVRCPVAAQDEPGTCETPRERGQGKATAYTAVAEFAGTGEGGSTPLLLRSGSNTADTEGS
ncbi:hypothetical protein OG357_18950 [Streptomyces sp. NBC_01255]|uniref:hypothetical protein n=1 Tax=Streptomyces sp. NBC_01255 TaxID=2903798 RepID=UPI002E30FB67|nr:hypothetical protein [Streptomyces sp. NBC_01255]